VKGKSPAETGLLCARLLRGVMMMMMVPVVPVMMMMGLCRRRDRHQHGDRKQHRAERKQHFLHGNVSWYAIGSRRTVILI
jgi:hypothetical protein